MLYYPFQNYEEFKELFGMQEHGNGVKSRRNKILLQWYKQKWVLHAATGAGDEDRMLYSVRSMTALWSLILNHIGWDSDRSWHYLRLADVPLYSGQYKLDDYSGLCEDGDTRAVRYINCENGRVFKMRAGKFFKAVALETAFGRKLSEPIMLWLCEEFTQRWTTWASGRVQHYELKVDDDFASIYSGYKCVGNFHSCMTDNDQYSFYEDAVDAKAASLRNDEGRIVARCIVFTEVHDDETGEIVRLAERQYATDGDDVLKRILVDKLIEGGYIDGYKKVGADCSSESAFVSNDGKDWSNRRFGIRCDLERGDRLSYQDSFKSYNIDDHWATNYDVGSYSLDVTDTYFESEGDNWDSWHEEYTDNDVVDVYYHGREYTCDEEELDDFRYVSRGDGAGEYHHEDDVVYCEDIDGYVLEDDATFSELLQEYWYDVDDMEAAEEEWHQDNGEVWSEYDEEWYPKDEVVVIHYNNGTSETISRESLGGFDCEERDGEFYEMEEIEVEQEVNA